MDTAPSADVVTRSQANRLHATRGTSEPPGFPGRFTPSHPDTHDRIRHDTVDKAGSVTLRHNSRLHHIGHRTNPRRNLRHPARPRPSNTGRQRRHRRVAPRTDPRPTPRLPTHRSAQRTHPTIPEMTTAEPTNVGPAVADVLRHHKVPPAGFEPATPALGEPCSIP